MRKLLLLFAALAVCADAQTWTNIQKKSSMGAYTNSGTLTITASSSGNALVLATSNKAQGGNYNHTVVSDNKNNTWTHVPISGANGYADPSSTLSTDIWYCFPCTAGVTTVNITVSGGTVVPGWLSMWVEEWTPPTSTITVEASISTVSVAAPPTKRIIGNVTTTGNDLIFVAGGFPGLSRVGSPFLLSTVNPAGDTTQDASIATATSVQFGTWLPAFQVSTGNFMSDASLVGVAFKSGAGSTSCGADCGGDLPSAPALSLSCPGNSAVATAAYSDSVRATGGTAPFTFALKSGTLPPGIIFTSSTAAFSGTPTTSGTYTFIVSATDSGTGANFQSAETPSCSITVKSTIAGLPNPSTTFTGTCNVDSQNREAWTWANQPCTINVTTPTDFALATGSVGTLSCTSACTSTIYTPPTTVVPNAPSRYGCPVDPIDSIWQARIDNLPINPNSSTMISTYAVGHSYQIGLTPALSVNRVDNSTPTKVFINRYTHARDNVLMPQAVHPDILREGGAYFNSPSSDHYTGYVNTDTCQWYELYQDNLDHSQDNPNDLPYCPNCTTGSSNTWGVGTYDLAFDLNTNPHQAIGTTTGAGAPRLNLTWTADDIRNGIHRAIESVMPTGAAMPQNVAGAVIWPATTPSFNAGCSDPTKCIPYGARWRLNKTWCTNNLATYSAIAQNIILGLCNYGSVVVDLAPATNGWLQIEFALADGQDPGVRAAINEVENTHKIPFNSNTIEFVDESSLQADPEISRVNPNNAYYTPSIFTVINASNGNTATIGMAVLPISVGTTHPAFATIAGIAGQQLDSWVRGAANQTVTWTHVSGPGSVTTGGVYTPPATTSSVQTDILTATAATDSNATQTVVVTVFPADSGHPNGFAVDVANNSGCTTGTGCTRRYISDDNTPQTIGFTYDATSGVAAYPAWAASVPDAAVWNTNWHTLITDLVYGPFMVPNGNYVITWMNGADSHTGCGQPRGGTYPPQVSTQSFYGPVMLDANNSVGGVLDFGLLSGQQHLCYQPVTYTTPVKVTNGFINTIAMRMLSKPYPGMGAMGSGGILAYGMNTPATYARLSGLAVDQDTTTTPYWAMDCMQAVNIKAGDIQQCREIDFWTDRHCDNPDMAPSNDTCTWLVDGVAGGGSLSGTISSTGLYTAPAIKPAMTTSHTISVTDGTYSASYDINVVGQAFPAFIH